jgi:hypothetical protein
MLMPRQAPPVRRDGFPRASASLAGRSGRAGGVTAAGTTVLRLSEIANNPSILMDNGENMLGRNPEIHFDIEPPTAPIEMCDCYCIDQRGAPEHGRKTVHAHIYGDVPGSGSVGPGVADAVSPHIGMCDVYCMDARERVIHGHIYGQDQPREA